MKIYYGLRNGKARKVRWLAALDKKPALFRSLRFSKFTRSNAKD